MSEVLADANAPDVLMAGGANSGPPAMLPAPVGGPMLARLRQVMSEGPVRQILPVFVGLSVIGAALLAWSVVSPSSQRLLYAQLGDGDRATVVSALDQAGIYYSIDEQTGALSVDTEDFYRARMIVASDGGIAAPESGAQMLDSLRMGARRALEGERRRAARERDLMLTIREIDGVESVRVHLAEGEKSVFVRDNVQSSASVMLRLAGGKRLSNDQVAAILNLVAGSVPGLASEAVRVVDQHGRLLSEEAGTEYDRLDLQTRMEDKLRAKVVQLLTPMLGEGAFSSEIQVELDMDEVTSAREAYDKDGVVRRETVAESTTTSAGTAGGVPGATANTPPPAAEARPGPPEGGVQQPEGQGPVTGESSSSRSYELGREVSVSSSSPGRIRRLSVAVAISKEAMKGTKPADVDQIRELVGAAVGASEERGDTVKIVSRSFEKVSEEEMPFYETGWFASVVRHGAALLALLLVLLFGIRPLVKNLKRGGSDDPEEGPDADGVVLDSAGEGMRAVHGRMSDPAIDRGLLDEKVGLARRLIAEQPDNAVAALRQMLKDQPAEDAAAEASQ